MRWYAGVNDGVNQRWSRNTKEKICIVMFSPNGMHPGIGMHRNIRHELISRPLRCNPEETTIGMLELWRRER
jgi:hypothetical protein